MVKKLVKSFVCPKETTLLLSWNKRNEINYVKIMKNFFCLGLFSILIFNSYTLFAFKHIDRFSIEERYLSDSIPNEINKKYETIFRSLADRLNILDYNYLIQVPKQEKHILTPKNRFIDPSLYRHYCNLTSITIPNTIISVRAQSFRGTFIKRNLPPPRDFELIKDWAGKNCSLWISINLSIDMLY